MRDDRTGKGRYDLISPFFLQRLAVHLERGARKYRARNWEQGMPLSRYFDSAMRHAEQILVGDTSEDHAAAWAFNVMAFIHTQTMIRAGKLPPELDDMPDYTVKRDGEASCTG
jgi:hypothetical protein